MPSEGSSGSGSSSGGDETAVVTTDAVTVQTGTDSTSSGGLDDATSSDSGTGSETSATECPCGEFEFCIDDACEPAAHVIYLNFDAEGTFQYDETASEDATTNTHAIHESFDGSGFTPYGEGPKRDEVFAGVQADFAPYRVVITDERPVDVSYSMLVFTGDNPSGNPNLPAMGTTDCNNSVPNSIYFMFFTETDPFPAQLQLNLASRSIARGIGLDLVEDEVDLMYRMGSTEDLAFMDTCLPNTETAVCPIQHQIHCGGGTQNSHAELSTAWGLIES